MICYMQDSTVVKTRNEQGQDIQSPDSWNLLTSPLNLSKQKDYTSLLFIRHCIPLWSSLALLAILKDYRSCKKLGQ